MKVNCMKKILVMLAAAAVLAGCGGKKSEGDNASIPVEDMQWKKTDPYEMDFRPFKMISKDWMALAVGSGDRMNSMTVSWGILGELWSRPVFTVFVRSSRYTKKLMDENKYFTVSAFPQTAKNRESLVHIGGHSKKDDPDKTANAGLEVEYSELGNPLFRQSDLAFECRILYREELKEELLPPEIRKIYAEGDPAMHTMYIGEIVNVYVKEQEQ